MGNFYKVKKEEMSKHRVYSGMPDEEYEAVCKELFFEHDANGDKVLVIDEFKEFTIACARAAGVSEEDIEGMKSEGSDSMWSMMFRQFDANNDGSITWEEAWGFLKENRP